MLDDLEVELVMDIEQGSLSVGGGERWVPAEFFGDTWTPENTRQSGLMEFIGARGVLIAWDSSDVDPACGIEGRY